MGTVLLVDSDTETTDPIVSVFAAAGERVETLGDGGAAVGRLEQGSFDAVLLRVEHRRVSGYAICNQIKGHERLRQIPLVLLSSEATREVFDQHRKLRTAADGYAYLPCHGSELLALVQRLTSLELGAQKASEPAIVGSPPRRKAGGAWPWIVLAAIAALIIAAVLARL